MLGVDRAEKVEEIKAFVEKFKLTYPIFQDPVRELYSKFTPMYIPWNVVLDAEGRILYSAAGFDGDAVRQAVDEALKTIKK